MKTANEGLICPIEGCNFHYRTQGRGWVKHVESARLHPFYHPTIHNPEQRVAIYRKEFSAWLENLPSERVTPIPPAPKTAEEKGDMQILLRKLRGVLDSFNPAPLGA